MPMDLLDDIDLAPKLARKTKRWVAALMDYFFWLVIVAVLSYFFGDTETEIESSINGNNSVSYTRSLTGWAGFFAMTIPWFLLVPILEGLNNGQTLGKAIMRVRAVKESGERLTMDRAILRHIVDFVDYFPFLGIVGLIVASNNQNNKRVGDMVGRTLVIEA